MGEIAEMMLDGTMCAGCGEWLNDGEDGEGYPGYCEGCADDYREVAPERKKPLAKIMDELKTPQAKFQSPIDKMLGGVEKSMGGHLTKRTRKILILLMEEALKGLEINNGMVAYKGEKNGK